MRKGEISERNQAGAKKFLIRGLDFSFIFENRNSRYKKIQNRSNSFYRIVQNRFMKIDREELTIGWPTKVGREKIDRVKVRKLQ